MYLKFYPKKIGPKAQTPTNESTKQEFFANPWFFFIFFLRFILTFVFWQNYNLNMLNKPYITDTESKIWTKCPDSDERVHNAGNFL
jgi:hypothetical protein